MQAMIATLLFVWTAASDPSPDAVVEKQRQTAAANIKATAGPPMTCVETMSLLVWSNLPESKSKLLAAQLEKQHSTAMVAVQPEKGDRPWPGKLTVYLLPDAQQFRSFVRLVEKRSPDGSEHSSRSTTGDVPHVAVGPGRAANAVSLETQAGYEIASAVLLAKTKGAPLPEWVTVGFSRAVTAHAANQTPSARKKAARDLVRARVRPREAWGDDLPLAQRQSLAAAIMDFVAFGGGIKLDRFLGGFRPDDQKPNKTAEDALAGVDLTVEQFEVAFIKWLATAK